MRRLLIASLLTTILATGCGVTEPYWLTEKTAATAPAASYALYADIRTAHRAGLDYLVDEGFRVNTKARGLPYVEKDEMGSVLADANRLFIKRALQEGITIDSRPIVKNRDAALYEKLIVEVPPVFNPRMRASDFRTPDTFVKNLTWLGYNASPTGLYRGNTKEKTYEAICLFALLSDVETPEGRLLSFTHRLVAFPQPWLSPVAALREAELAARNWDFDAAEKAWQRAPKAKGSQAVRRLIDEEKAVMPRILRARAATRANTEKWAKIDRERAAVTSGDVLRALTIVSNTMAETARIDAESRLAASVAQNEARRINQSRSDVYEANLRADRAEAKNKALTDGSSSAADEAHYRREMAALDDWQAAQIESKALWRVQSDLIVLYNDKEKGRVCRETLDRAIHKAEAWEKRSKKAYDALIAEDAHREAVTRAIGRSEAKSARLNLRVPSSKIEKRYRELKEDYGHFYRQNRY